MILILDTSHNQQFQFNDLDDMDNFLDNKIQHREDVSHLDVVIKDQHHRAPVRERRLQHVHTNEGREPKPVGAHIMRQK